MTLSTLVTTRVDATVDFNWGVGSPAAGVAVDNFSVRWTGEVLAPASGTYAFSTVSDDGIRLWVNGQQLVNNWTDHAPTTNTGTIALTGGQRYSIRLEYYEHGDGAVARLSWTPPGGASQVIPQAQLFPATAAPPPANQPPTASAGADQTVSSGAMVTLDGSGSSDPNQDPLAWQWRQTAGPAVTLAGASTARPTFTAPTVSAATALDFELTVSDGSASAVDTVRVTVQPPASSDNGLTGQYFNGMAFNTLVTTRVDATINFNWGVGAPATGVAIDNFSVRWTGEVLAPATGTYTFSTVSDDGVRLWIGGQQLVNNWTDHAPTTNTGTISLVAGQRYPVVMEYYEHGDGAVARLSWTPPGGTSQIIPQSQLFPAP
jgi:hypothetical protein